MSFEDFTKSPWQNPHATYADSAFKISPAPEFCTSEVLVSSLYRACGFVGYSENEVFKAGKEFDRTTTATRRSRDETGRIKTDTWRTVVHGVLESPKQPNQSSKRFLQLCPVVPDIALYSGSARLVGNSWNPGALVQRMVQMGAAGEPEAQALWARLYEALSVSVSDDLWARWLQDEFRHRAKTPRAWAMAPLPSGGVLPEEDKKRLSYPAQQFVKDLDATILAKDRMTRRQWISVLEAILRLGCVMHVLWLCHVNDRVWRRAREILWGNSPVPSLEEVRTSLVSAERRYLAYGNAAIADIKQYASDYLVSRLGINAVLWAMPVGHVPLALDSCAGIQAFLAGVEAHRDYLLGRGVKRRFLELTEAEARTIACKKGIGSNMVEFARHSLGQRKAADEALRGYDQGYILKKVGEGRSAPFTVSFGPVAVLALVHACLREAAGPRSVKTLCNHLGAYGVETDLGDASSGELGKQLRMLGLVLDSPDAESGMLLMPPF